jgi:hypothetical protein
LTTVEDVADIFAVQRTCNIGVGECLQLLVRRTSNAAIGIAGCVLIDER